MVPVMSYAKLTTQGRITIPRKVRKELRLAPGDKLEFLQIAPGRFQIVACNKKVTELKGMFGSPKNAVSIESMNQAIAHRASDSHQS
jgi:AbrB family looped-hinge helix DNA binding protein